MTANRRNIDIKLKQLSAGHDGTVWGVNDEGEAVVWDPARKFWSSAPECRGCPPFDHVTVGARNDVWAILRDQRTSREYRDLLWPTRFTNTTH